MQVKKYSEKSMQAAISKIKRELGEEAVILSTRRIPKGAKNPYGHDLFEIEAKGPGSSPDDGPTAGQTPTLSSLLHARSTEQTRYTASASDREISTENWQKISTELDDIKNVLFSLSVENTTGSYNTFNESEMDLYIKLLKNGISGKRIQLFIEQTRNYIDKPDQLNSLSSKNFQGHVIGKILESIPSRDLFPESAFSSERTAPKPSIAAFTGPTGAGKTTTVAKVAAWLSLQQKKRVGLISIDNYRIGAVEQLNTYSSIMGIPCISAFSMDDLAKAVQKLSAMDFILVDTAGQSHLDKKRLNNLDTILNRINGIEKHLVLSTTMDRLDMKDAAANFSTLNPSSYIFTKVDETKRRGIIADQVLDNKLPVSVITNGQKVPEDFLLASRKILMEVILGKNYLN